MFSVLSKRRILMLHEEAQGNPDMTRHTTILDHNIQSTTQGMIHLPRRRVHIPSGDWPIPVPVRNGEYSTRATPPPMQTFQIFANETSRHKLPSPFPSRVTYTTLFLFPLIGA